MATRKKAPAKKASAKTRTTKKVGAKTQSTAKAAPKKTRTKAATAKTTTEKSVGYKAIYNGFDSNIQAVPLAGKAPKGVHTTLRGAKSEIINRLREDTVKAANKIRSLKKVQKAK